MESWRIGAIATMVVFGAMYSVLVLTGPGDWAATIDQNVWFAGTVLAGLAACRTRKLEKEEE